jgi:hypothetical protein
MIRSPARQRTTPWIAGVGPSSTIRARNALCSSSSLAGAPGEAIFIRPSGPCSLKRITQSRSVWRSIPPVFAASSRDAPSRIAATARSRRACAASFVRFGQTANFGARIVCFHCNRSTHDKPPSGCQVESFRERFGNRESLNQRIGINISVQFSHTCSAVRGSRSVRAGGRAPTVDASGRGFLAGAS